MTLKTQEVFWSLVFLVLALAIFFSADGLLDGAGLFPQVAAVLIGISAAMTLGRNALGASKAATSEEPAAWGRMAIIVMACLVALFALRPIGFPIVAIVLFFVCSRAADTSASTPGNLISTAVISVAVVAALTGVFAIFLGVSLPMGPLAR